MLTPRDAGYRAIPTVSKAFSVEEAMTAIIEMTAVSGPGVPAFRVPDRDGVINVVRGDHTRRRTSGTGRRECSRDSGFSGNRASGPS